MSSPALHWQTRRASGPGQTLPKYGRIGLMSEQTFAYSFAAPSSPLTSFNAVYGVDFSGAKLAGQNTWIARLEPIASGPDQPFYRLKQLASLETLCGTAERAEALAAFVRMIAGSENALWALGFPFALPVEVMDTVNGVGADWRSQFDFLQAWGEDAYGAGVECLNRAKALGGPGHVRRQTDLDYKTPWDTYSYRIIYQTFYGMRDVLGPLRGVPGTAILPFDYACLPAATRTLVEACPASTLKRLGLPHQNYKQTGGKAPTLQHRRSRRAILTGLAPYVSIGRVRRSVLMKNPGGDALDAVIAAVGAILSWRETDHVHVSRHPRFVREGRHYA
jgi:hypothetical protein